MDQHLTQLVPGGEDGGAQARVVMRVCEGGETVLQPAVSQVQNHQAATDSQQQQEEDRDHHRRCVTRVALSVGSVATCWTGGQGQREATFYFQLFLQLVCQTVPAVCWLYNRSAGSPHS